MDGGKFKFDNGYREYVERLDVGFGEMGWDQRENGGCLAGRGRGS